MSCWGSSTGRDKGYDNWNKNRLYDRHETPGQWSTHVEKCEGPDHSKWARTEDPLQHCWNTGTNTNQQASEGPQHGGNSSSNEHSSATAANAGTTIRMSQLSDRKEDGSAPGWEFTKPARLYMVVRADLDTLRFFRATYTSCSKQLRNSSSRCGIVQQPVIRKKCAAPFIIAPMTSR